MTYKQLTEGERYTIAAYKKQGLSYTHIAKLTGRHKSTISREIARNVVLTMAPTGLSKPTNALGQDEVNLGVISALLSSNITKSYTLLKKTGVLLKWSEE